MLYVFAVPCASTHQNFIEHITFGVHLDIKEVIPCRDAFEIAMLADLCKTLNSENTTSQIFFNRIID